MTATFIALLPVFIVIIIGAMLRCSALVNETHWAGVDHICYFVLFPAIIFKEIAAADFAGIPVGGMAAAMVTLNMALFWIFLIGVFWLSRRTLAEAESPERIWADAAPVRDQTFDPALANEGLLEDG